ncbi:5-hydroxytryptamine receptor 1D-like [Clytia hemisphaerica]|uniref:G-protein coupled receptors family 1 profile domain-containing protein n=1 Tax=Clytia hemisphaerica TaxID=252671 RepID=A0A7M5V8E8_9CNID
MEENGYHFIQRTNGSTISETFTFPPFKIKPGYAKRDFTEPYRIIYIVICSILALISIVGNITLVTVISSRHKLRTATNLLLLSLATADLLTSVVYTPLYLERFYNQNANNSHPKLCLLRKYFFIVTASGSLISLAVVSFDRMFAIAYPYKYERWMTKRLACIVICIVWFWTICFNSITFHDFLHWGRILSTCVGGIPRKLFLIIGPPGFYIPGITIVVVYIKIYLVARKLNIKVEHDCKLSVSSNEILMTDLSNSSNHLYLTPPLSQKKLGIRRTSSLPVIKAFTGDINNSTRDANKTSLPFLMSHTLSTPTLKPRSSSTLISQTLHGGKETIRKVKKSIKRDIRTVRTIAMLVGFFLVCWMPTAGFYIYINIMGSSGTSVSQQVLLCYEIFMVLTFVNSALNPFLYTYRNKELRKETMKFARKLFRIGR